MKTLLSFVFLPCFARCVAAQPRRQLCGEWQDGLETTPGYTQKKLRLSFASLQSDFRSESTSNNNHEHTIDFGNGDGHLPLWWVRR